MSPAGSLTAVRRVYDDLHGRIVSHVGRSQRACRVSMGGAAQSISLNVVPSLISEVALHISHADVRAVR